jgi:hypothetical protein
VVLLLYALAGPLVCAGVMRLFQVTGLSASLPKLLDNKAIPPGPSLNNVLFGAGAVEVFLASGLAGWWLWQCLWRARVAEEAKSPWPAAFRALLPQALLLGPLMAFISLFFGAVGFDVRAAPGNIPMLARFAFALLAAPLRMVSALLTGIIPVVLVFLGLLMGAITALAVAVLWQEFPEEAAFK